MPAIYYIRHGRDRLERGKAGCRARRILRSMISDAGRQPAPAAFLPICSRARTGAAKQALAYVASPLGRARSTMELVRGALRLPLHDYTIDDRLREIGYGDWEGSTLAQMQARDPEVFARRQVDKWTVVAAGRRELCLGADPGA